MATAIRVRPGTVQADARPLPGSRHAWIDNLRVTVITGVIVCHVAASYAIPMPWYYEERSASAATAVALSALFGPAVLYAMAVLFLVAGILAPRSLRRKGAARFIGDRLLRLGLPLAVTVLLLVPLTALAGALGEGAVDANHAAAFLAVQLQEADTGVMWFAAALLVFSTAYALFRAARPARSAAAGPLGWRHLAFTAGAVAAGSFVVRLIWPALSITPLHLTLWDWPTMAALFTLGVVAGERDRLNPISERLVRACGWIGLLSAVAATVFFAVVALSGDGRLLGGWYLEAAFLPLIEGVLAVAMCLWLVGWFSVRWNQDGPPSRVLGRASYGAYILHPTVIVLLGVALRGVATAAELKLVVVSIIGVAASFGVGVLLTRVRALARIL